MIDLERQWQPVLMTIALLMSRMLVAFSVIPLFVGDSVPGFIRISFVAGLSCALLPLALADNALLTVPLTGMLVYVAKETFIGLVLGLAASASFWALHIAGSIIEYQAGLTMATTIDPLTAHEDSLVGGLLMRLFTALFLVTGGLLSLIGMLFESYRVWPLASLTPIAGKMELVEVLLGNFGEMLATALKVATPFLVVMLLFELALGLLSRFAPQFNAFFLSLPLKAVALAAVLLIYGMVVTSGDVSFMIGDYGRLLEPFRAVLRD